MPLARPVLTPLYSGVCHPISITSHIVPCAHHVVSPRAVSAARGLIIPPRYYGGAVASPPPLQPSPLRPTPSYPSPPIPSPSGLGEWGGEEEKGKLYGARRKASDFLHSSSDEEGKDKGKGRHR